MASNNFFALLGEDDDGGSAPAPASAAAKSAKAKTAPKPAEKPSADLQAAPSGAP
ncbi:hypothetical protein HK405_002622, partial [Cladochytrium tenue]